ncbi:hypothetical protein [Arthrobacter sp. H14]|uniref:hypothetical protein n=1 Tax=Arthrobacter sp. H14 TaxID=1312959 RepID=UPI0004AF9297|nr:hypothetical protein [Arthrobacter sp. H14]
MAEEDWVLDEPEVDLPEERYRTLPARIPIEDTIPTKDASPPPDPEMGRNPDRDFMLRNAAG